MCGPEGKGSRKHKKAVVMYEEMGVSPRSYWLARTQEALGRLQ